MNDIKPKTFDELKVGEEIYMYNDEESYFNWRRSHSKDVEKVTITFKEIDMGKEIIYEVTDKIDFPAEKYKHNEPTSVYGEYDGYTSDKNFFIDIIESHIEDNEKEIKEYRELIKRLNEE